MREIALNGLSEGERIEGLLAHCGFSEARVLKKNSLCFQ